MKKSIILSMALMSALMVNAGSLDKGVDRNNLDLTTTPGTDFYQYACGGWMKAHPLTHSMLASVHSTKWQKVAVSN